MVAAVLANRVRQRTSTTGTGTVALGAAYSNAFMTFAEAGVPNGAQVRYELDEGADFEIGLGTYDSATDELTRDLVVVSKISGVVGTAKMNLAGAAVVRITFAAEDYNALARKAQQIATSGLLTGGGDLSADRTLDLSANAKTGNIIAQFDGGPSPITTGVKGYLPLDFSGVFLGWTLVGDVTGSIVVDIWKDSYANALPTVADTITASAKPTISGGIKGQSSVLTGWTTSFSAGDILGFNIDSNSAIKFATLALKVQKS